jgi:hypothetical protein
MICRYKGVVMGVKVNIKETYPGSCWYSIEIDLPGYGCKKDGTSAGKFYLIPADHEYIEDMDLPFFRPEYAKAIAKALNGVTIT